MRPLAVPDGNVPSEIIPVFILPRFFRFVKIRSQNFFRFRLKFFQSFPSADPQQKPNVPRRQQNTFRLPSPVLDCVFGFLYPDKTTFLRGRICSIPNRVPYTKNRPEYCPQGRSVPSSAVNRHTSQSEKRLSEERKHFVTAFFSV